MILKSYLLLTGTDLKDRQPKDEILQVYKIVSKTIIKIFMILILSGLLVGSFLGTRDICSETDNVDKFQNLTKRLPTTTEPKKIGLINASKVNIRKGPNLESDIIGTVINKGAIAEVIGQNGAWYKARIGGIEGWVYGDYVSPGETIDEPKQNQLSNVETSKESWPRGPGFGLPLEGVSLPCPLRGQGKLSPCF